MRCSNCDALMKEGAMFCGKCGAKAPEPTSKCKVCGWGMVGDEIFCPHCGMDRRLVENQYAGRSSAPPPAYLAPPPIPPPVYAPQAISTCGSCGMGVPAGSDRCPYCNHKLRNHSGKDYAGIGGALVLIAGIINVSLFGLVSLGASLDLDQFGSMAAIFMVLTFLNVISLYGAICAIRRKRYTVSMIGAIVIIFSFVFFLGIAAVVLLAISKDAFQDKGNDQYDPGRREGYL